MVPSPDMRPGRRRAAARVSAVLVLLTVALAGVASPPAHAAAKASVTVKNYSFSEPDLVIDPGTEVTWTAIQGDHTVTSEGGSFDEVIAQDYQPHSFSYTFTKPGRYTYYCGFHRMKGMQAIVEVRGAPGETTTTEPPTTTTMYQPPTTTTTAPPETTTTTVPPATATTAAPTTTTAAPAIVTATSTGPAVNVPTTKAPATTAAPVPSTAGRPAPAGAGPGATPPASTATSSSAPSAVAPARTTSPTPDVAHTEEPKAASEPTLAAPDPAPELRAGRAAAHSSRDGGRALLVVLLAVGGLAALAGAAAAGTLWLRRR